jgi:hypothetical protein
VKGTLDAPSVRLSSKAATALAMAYAQPGYAGDLREKAEKALGKDGGAAVDQGLEILNGILGGSGRKSKPAPEAEPGSEKAPTESGTPESPAASPPSQ